MSRLPQGVIFSLCNEKNKTLLETLKENIVGGPALVFHRYHKVDNKFILGYPEAPCKKLLGLDINALNLNLTMQEMPTDYPVCRFKEHGFRPKVQVKFGSKSHQCMIYLMKKNQIPEKNLFHQNNKKE